MSDHPSAGPAPVFIDFEGIDGSGKTTLSNRIADYLRQCGIEVCHSRDRGVFRSEISKAIRALTRDPRFLRMSDVTELLLYVARDTQMIDEYIRPRLQPGNVVFSDRYLYSAIAHSCHGRGLDRTKVEAVLDLASRGLWPDLVVYCDVDPLTSRLRKKIQKIKDRRPSSDFGRKGLMGIGFRESMREGFLELARESPERWVVIDNARYTVEQSLQRIFGRVRDVLEQKGYGRLPDPDWAQAAEATAAAASVSPLEESITQVLGIEDEEERQLAAARAFFAELWRLEPERPDFAALFLSGIGAPEAHELRLQICDREPAVVAHGLRGVNTPESLELRERLRDREPVYVARSLSSLQSDPRACALRLELAETCPEQIALAVRGSDSEHAWEIRQRIKKVVPREVLLSLRGLDTEAAWKIREKRAKPAYYPQLLESLGGLDTDRAWEWRDRLMDEYLPWVLISLRGLDSDRAWELRARHIARAPKIIIKGIGRSEDERAWELRDQAKHFAKEVLDSLSGLDDSQAWHLRDELREKWPNTCVSSLGAGNQSPRAWKFRWEMLEENKTNLLLLKHLYKAVQRAVEENVSDDDEDDLT